MKYTQNAQKICRRISSGDFLGNLRTYGPSGVRDSIKSLGCGVEHFTPIPSARQSLPCPSEIVDRRVCSGFPPELHVEGNTLSAVRNCHFSISGVADPRCGVKYNSAVANLLSTLNKNRKIP